MLKNCIYIKKLLFLSVLSIELLLLQLSLSMTLFLFLTVGTTWNQGASHDPRGELKRLSSIL